MTRRLRAPGTLPGVLRDTADARGSKVAFRCGDQAVTFAGLWQATQRAAAALINGGVGDGDVVAVACRDRLERIVAHLGALAAGACALPVNPGYRTELEVLLPAAGVHTVVGDAELADRLPAVTDATGWSPRRVWISGQPADGGARSWGGARDAAPPLGRRRVGPDAPALCCFTSGTTGTPKAVVHTHARCLYNLESLRRAWEWTASDVLYLPVVLFHVHGLQNGVHGTLVTGCTTVLPTGHGFDPVQALAELAAERCSLMFGVPTHYQRLLEAARRHPADTRTAAECMRLWVSGSAPLPGDTFHRFRERFGHDVLERYGMTETLMISSNPARGERRAGTVGHPLPGVAARVVNPADGLDCLPGAAGEVWVRGASVLDGYGPPGAPDAAANAAAFRDGWFRTGDEGAWEPDGRLRLIGRLSDVIISGGMNVAPAEVEQALLSHPDVLEAGVAGVPDDDLVELVAAAVVVRPQAAVDGAQLVAHVAHRLAGFKKPRRLCFVDALPRNDTGKLDRAALRAVLANAPLAGGGDAAPHRPPPLADGETIG